MSIFYLKKYSALTICMFIYCFALSVFAQDTAISSPQFDTIAYKKSLEEKSFYKLTRIFHKEKNRDSLKTSIIAKHLRTNFLDAKDLKQVAGACITLTYWEEKQGNLAEVFLLFDKGIQTALQIENDSLLCLAYLRKGIFNFNLGKNRPALDAYYKALDVAKSNNDVIRQVAVSVNIALVKMQANDVNGAIALLLESLETVNKNPDLVNDRSKLNLYANLCGAYTYIEDYEAASFYCNEGMKINESVNNLRVKAHFLSSFAEIETSKGAYSKAYKLLDESEELINEVGGNESLQLFVKFYRGKTYYAEGKFQEATEELLAIEKLKEKYKVDFLSLQEMYYYLALSYTELGNIKESIKYHKKASELDAKNDKKKNEINADIVQKFDLVKLKEKIDALEAASKRNKYLYFVGIGLLSIIIIGLVLINRRQRQKNKKRFDALMHQLKEKRQQEKESVKVKDVVQVSKTEPLEINNKDAEILEKLKQFETKELFLSKESTLVEVAKKIQTNTTYLSKVINTHKKKSFTAYITDLRVDYAIERLSHDRKFRSFTIGAIAQEIGFKRSESFSKAFKVKTGLYPSYFIKELEKQIDINSN